MANPDPIDVASGTIVEVAANVTKGWIRNLDPEIPVLCTYRLTTTPKTAAPSYSDFEEEGYLIFQTDPTSEEIDSSSAIDIYVHCPTKACRLRVDLP